MPIQEGPSSWLSSGNSSHHIVSGDVDTLNMVGHKAEVRSADKGIVTAESALMACARLSIESIGSSWLGPIFAPISPVGAAGARRSCVNSLKNEAHLPSLGFSDIFSTAPVGESGADSNRTALRTQSYSQT